MEKFKASLDVILREAIKKNAKISVELKHVLEMLIEHENRINRIEDVLKKSKRTTRLSEP